MHKGDDTGRSQIGRCDVCDGHCAMLGSHIDLDLLPSRYAPLASATGALYRVQWGSGASVVRRPQTSSSTLPAGHHASHTPRALTHIDATLTDAAPFQQDDEETEEESEELEVQEEEEATVAAEECAPRNLASVFNETSLLPRKRRMPEARDVVRTVLAASRARGLPAAPARRPASGSAGGAFTHTDGPEQPLVRRRSFPIAAVMAT
jgi:hypothetical protein